MKYFFSLGVYNQRKTTAPSTAAQPPYSSGGNLIPTSSQPHSFSSTTTPMGPILPLAPYELKHPTLSSGVSQPLSSIGNDFPGISRVTSTSGPVPTRRSNLSNTLPSPRRRQQMKEMLEAKPSSKDDSSGVKPQNVRLLFFTVVISISCILGFFFRKYWSGPQILVQKILFGNFEFEFYRHCIGCLSA